MEKGRLEYNIFTLKNGCEFTIGERAKQNGEFERIEQRLFLRFFELGKGKKKEDNLRFMLNSRECYMLAHELEVIGKVQGKDKINKKVTVHKFKRGDIEVTTDLVIERFEYKEKINYSIGLRQGQKFISVTFDLYELIRCVNVLKAVGVELCYVGAWYKAGEKTGITVLEEPQV